MRRSQTPHFSEAFTHENGIAVDEFRNLIGADSYHAIFNNAPAVTAIFRSPTPGNRRYRNVTQTLFEAKKPHSDKGLTGKWESVD